MILSSTIFVFMFLPIVSVLYLLVHKELRNYVLLMASLLFYAWGEPNYLVIILLTILVNYIGTVCIGSSQREWLRKIQLPLTLLFNMGIRLTSATSNRAELYLINI